VQAVASCPDLAEASTAARQLDTYKAFELAPKILHGIVSVNSPTVTDEIHAPMEGRAQQRLGTHRSRMPRRFQRHHLDQRHRR